QDLTAMAITKKDHEKKERERCKTSSRSTTDHRLPSRIKGTAPFLLKTYDLLEEEEEKASGRRTISWNVGGTSFVVWFPAEFAELMLPRFFKHNNFSSFIRQLNTYGFRKISSKIWEFKHDKFKKGCRHLLGEITRKRSEPSLFPTYLKVHEDRYSRGQSLAEDQRRHLMLIEQSRNLLRQNMELKMQVSHYKDLQTRLLDFLSQFTSKPALQGQKACLVYETYHLKPSLQT
ncbi:hypothetical protein Ancab_005206, partial [Ancistrocladus abbreviatus]